MTLVKGTIGLGIRERLPETNVSKYKSVSTQRWLDELPMANLGETSRRVYNRLLESNGKLIDVKLRVGILSSLESSVEHICDSLKKHYTGQSVSLTEKQKKVANLCQAIQLEMAIGFKTIIEDLLNDEKYDSELLPLSVNHALFYFHSVQVRSYQLYSELSPGLWHEIHLLYQLAEQNQFHEKKFSISNKLLKAADTYKKILLLATTNPNQLRQRDIEMIANNLSIVIRKCTLGSDPDADYDFVVNLNADASPFHRALIKDGMKAHYRGVNVSNIVLLLQDELKTVEREKRKTRIDDTVLRHLLRAWGTMATRAFSRTPGTGSIKISVGLAGCHYLINKELYGEDDAPEDLEGEKLINSLEGSLKDAVILDNTDSQKYNIPKASHPNWSSSKDDPAIKADNLWDSMFINKKAQDVTDESKPYGFMGAEPLPKKSATYDYQDATIINVSPGGYCLKLDGLLPKQTQTGEIIGLLELSNDGRHIWNIGNIRWMQRHESGDLQLGVQLIAPNAVPVLGQVIDEKQPDYSYLRCLLLPALVGIGQPPTILTSPIPYAVEHQVRVKSNDHAYDIRLTKLLSSGQSYKQFEYEKLEVDINEEEQKVTDTDFSSVWDLL